MEKSKDPLWFEDLNSIFIKGKRPGPTPSLGALIVTVPIDSIMLSVEDMIDEFSPPIEYYRAGWTFVSRSILAGMEDSVYLENIVDAISGKTPFTDVPGEMDPEAFFVGVSFVAEAADLRLPGHGTRCTVLCMRDDRQNVVEWMRSSQTWLTGNCRNKEIPYASLEGKDVIEIVRCEDSDSSKRSIYNVIYRCKEANS